MNDLKFAFRQLLKNPGFTAVAVLTLALGIGANTAIFSFVNTILLRPLPFMEPERLVMVYTSYQANDSHKNWVAAPTLNEWRKQSTVFEGLAARSLTVSSLPEEASPKTFPARGFLRTSFDCLASGRCWGATSIRRKRVMGKTMSCCSATNCGSGGLAAISASSAKASH